MEELLIRFRLIGDEASGLRKLAKVECRTAVEQTRYLLQQELARRGLQSATEQDFEGQKSPQHMQEGVE